MAKLPIEEHFGVLLQPVKFEEGKCKQCVFVDDDYCLKAPCITTLRVDNTSVYFVNVEHKLSYR